MQQVPLKACAACTKAKRRCSREVPCCMRCRVRGLDCTYAGVSASSVVTCPLATPNTWDALLDDAWSPVLSPTISLPLVSLPAAWFLLPETWTVHALPRSHLAPVRPNAAWRYIRTVRGWLADWVHCAGNAFCHPQLYAAELPTCIADAITGVAAYLARTPASEPLMYRILESRAADLVRQPPPPAQDCRTQLARVQALLAYAAIRLFDADIRQRYQAEQQLPALKAWAHALLASAREMKLPDGRCGDVGATERWHAWIVAESVRRTWLVAQSICAMFWTMQRGSAECPGQLAFTARRGVWDAASSGEWMRACGDNVDLMHQTQLELVDLDEFGQAFMELTVPNPCLLGAHGG
ncbi:hypothetical protein ASPZODRAFT_137034 [Penicilliopsis zonata CBS 506.65]|uniref:Zn(2)-C6 fungal-type domain-containing protein n=1 Tax=Penicilliopsis zonata CBS 506.65 TaxID=1073090 RepID=A0A1L9S661_9EURO|nr:hypothetical protein ASPZODRAFT_137034 [Penicilliopsis zonata CBS 506.65]OJJ42646.1 hypothetical protein ASPZODRAFT_137034 [Penicilliopsis zonata CBS 506.65]